MGRAPCCDKANVKKGPWSPEEDTKLKEYIEKYGTGGNWIALPQKAGLKRCGKSCRLRWLNYLRPNIKHGEFSEEEDSIICSLFASIGSRWSIIAAQLPGRTDNDIKNYWNTKLKKKILGISPSQRKPYHHNHQQQQHLLPSLKSPNAPPSLAAGNCFNTPKRIFSSLESIPISSDVISSLTSSPFQGQMHQHQMKESPPLFQGQMHQHRMKESSTLLMFGCEQSYNSSEGTCTQISYRKEVDYEFSGEQLGFENYLYDGVEASQKLPLGGCHEGAQMERGNEFCLEASSGYGYEETKLLGSLNNGCNNLCLDDPSIGARAMYYY